MPETETIYDVIAYPGLAFADTHPGNLAARAILHGLSPAPVHKCRVLEIACNQGGNLIPMASAIPTSEFVGFDLAGSTIEHGKQTIGELGLTNVHLFQADLMEVGAELGKFDYIIAHGLYAWVPEQVQEGLMKLIGGLLAPQGVAFVSYNALPGGYIRIITREMMLGRIHGTAKADEQIAGVVKMLRSVMATATDDDAYRALIDIHLEKLGERPAFVTFHDELADSYRPAYFLDFMARAHRHGLQYLAEAPIPPPTDPCYRRDTMQLVEAAVGGDVIQQEHLLDFVRCRKFRSTLLCKSDCVVRRDYPEESFRKLRYCSPVTIGPGRSEDAREFTLVEGIKMESNNPAVLALVGELVKRWPKTASYDELEPHLKAAGFKLDREGITMLIRLAVSRTIEFQCWEPPVAPALSERPRVSAYNLSQVRSTNKVTSLLHTMVELEEPISQTFFPLLDGTRDRAAIAAVLRVAFPDMPVEELEGKLDRILNFIYRAGMLVG